MRLPGLLCVLAASLGLSACATSGYRDASQPITVETGLDLDRYLGLWYEIARFPNRFERD